MGGFLPGHLCALVPCQGSPWEDSAGMCHGEPALLLAGAVPRGMSSGGFLFKGFLTFPISPQTSETSSKKKKKKKQKEVEESSE